MNDCQFVKYSLGKRSFLNRQENISEEKSYVRKQTRVCKLYWETIVLKISELIFLLQVAMRCDVDSYCCIFYVISQSFCICYV